MMYANIITYEKWIDYTPSVDNINCRLKPCFLFLFKFAQNNEQLLDIHVQELYLNIRKNNLNIRECVLYAGV